jgi:hypothetical protein
MPDADGPKILAISGGHSCFGNFSSCRTRAWCR